MEDVPFHTRVPARLRGLLILAIGGALSWWQIWLPLTALKRGQTEVTISNLGIGAAAVLTVLGAAMVLIGQGFENLMEAAQPDPKNISFKSLLLIVPIALLAIAAYIWVQMRLSAMGFERN